MSGDFKTSFLDYFNREDCGKRPAVNLKALKIWDTKKDPNEWMYYTLNCAGRYLIWVIDTNPNPDKRYLAVGLSLVGEGASADLTRLQANEAKLREELDWPLSRRLIWSFPTESDGNGYMTMVNDNIDPTDSNQWKDAYAWMCERLVISQPVLKAWCRKRK